MSRGTIDFENQNVRQITLAFVFGICSFALGFVQFSVPGLSGVGADFRELPLLISIFYIKHPLYLILECILTTLNTTVNGSYLGNFSMHLVALLAGFYCYRTIIKYVESHYTQGLLWAGFTIIYYGVFLAPIIILINMFFEISQEPSFWKNYQDVMYVARFEILSSAFGSSIFLIQLQIRRSLESHQKTLTYEVDKRTRELADANSELKVMNENLDQLVTERTQKVQDQFEQLLRYAHHNSHEVRAPLSRMQGLMTVILQEQNIETKMELIEKLKISSEELDTVIIEMNQILESELLKKMK